MEQWDSTADDRGQARTGLIGRMSIRFRLMLALATILSLFALSCLLSVANFEYVRAARSEAQATSAMLVTAATLGEGINRQEGALRGYVLAGSPRYARILDQADARVEQAIHVLQDATVDNAAAARLLARVDDLESAWKTKVEGSITAQVEAGQPEAARARLVRGESVAYLDPVRSALAELRTNVTHELAARNDVLDRRQRLAKLSLLALLLIGLVIGGLSALAIRRRVTDPLSTLTDTTRRLAAGERDIHVRFQRRADEIGAVARALETFRRIILAQDRAAWVRDQRGRLVALLNEGEDESALGRDLLAALAPLVGAGYGGLFTPASLAEDETHFSLQAAYGYDPTARTVFAPGEGLIGSVIESPRMIVLDGLPADYLPVRSGLGQAVPHTLVIAPALVGDRLAAVLEIALFAPLGDSARELLDTLLPHVGLVLLARARARRTAELLAESRDKTQALQASEARLREQRESLKQINAELRTQSEEVNAQAAELRASEEELRVQADEMQAVNTQLREQQDTLRQQADELTRLHAETRDRADALARASQYKSDFLANMSHELRTPLNSLLILSRSLADNDEGNLDDEQIESARIIHESGSNLLALINDILDLSKIEAGKMQVVAEEMALATLATHIERQFDHMARAKGLVLDVRSASDLPRTVVTDPAKIEQIIRNLVSNALKFTPHGRVQVVFSRPAAGCVFRNPELCADNTLEIAVIDDGIGIPADRLEHIFQAFEQVDASTSRHYGGTGLGLSISREMVRLLGGEIHVASQEGQGSRFTVFIRCDLESAAPGGGMPGVSRESSSSSSAEASILPGRTEREPAEPPGSDGPAARERPLLLIIDDDPVFSQVVARAAAKKGFDCEIAHDGESGLARADARVPDALILDLGLPGMDGWRVLDRLKAAPRTAKIPVHIVSAADDTGRSAHSGAVGYLRKPVTREDLDTLLTRAETLSGRKARRVLVIDDDRDAHAAILQLLRHQATEVISATRGDEALARLDGQAVDCVVLDLSLPDINGFELLERIAQRPVAPPVVVYSGRDLSIEETSRLRAHTDSIVIKGSHAQERLLDEISLFMHRIDETPRPGTSPPLVSRTDDDLAGATVLLVDDDMRNTFALSRVLRTRGLKVLMAGDGHKALDQLAAHDQVAVVLMDIMMPGMDGYETIRRIRAGQRHARVPIIALTAKAMIGDRDQCLAAGADDYMTKPLDTDRLIECIRSLIR